MHKAPSPDSATVDNINQLFIEKGTLGWGKKNKNKKKTRPQDREGGKYK